MEITQAAKDPDLERRVLYEAVRSHDTRFDGRLFVGVKTTGNYCRPVCSARMPKFENCKIDIR